MSNSIFTEPSSTPPDALQDALPSAPLADPVIERVVERVEQLLLRYEELQRANTLLSGQVSVLTDERDSLKSRLSAARARVGALLERLPENAVASLRPPDKADS